MENTREFSAVSPSTFKSEFHVFKGNLGLSMRSIAKIKVWSFFFPNLKKKLTFVSIQSKNFILLENHISHLHAFWLLCKLLSGR